MKKALYVVMMLIVVLLPSLGYSQERTGNETVPYMLWIPMVVGPKVCEDPGIYNWWYRNDRICRLFPDGNVYCWHLTGFGIDSSAIAGYVRVNGDEEIYEMYSDVYSCGGGLCVDYPIEPDTTYEVSFKLQCKDETWTDWTDWKEIVVPDEE